MSEKYKKLDHKVFKKNFKDASHYCEGVETLNLSSLRDFHKVIEIFNGYVEYRWRGQRCYPEQVFVNNKVDWKLRSTYDRYYKKGKIKSDVIFNNFKEKLKHLTNCNKIDFSKEYEVWAIGQEYGLQTPLLDWTKNPYIAAYFAFYEKKDENQTKDRVVYALNRAVKILIIKEKDPKTKEVFKRNRKIEFDFDTNHFDQEHHKRFIRQEGAFTKAYRGKDVKSVVKELWRKKKKSYATKVLLAEILIPDECSNEFLSYLANEKKITYIYLFPDHSGAVDICKIDLGLENLKCCQPNFN